MAMRKAVALALAAMLLPPTGARADGGDLYKSHCSVCHQTGGVGVAGVYPRLAGRAPKIAATADGRTVMISAALYGMAGKLEVDGKSLMGVMPGFSQMSDADLADLLTYVSALGGKAPKSFTAAEISTVRAGPRLTSSQINAMARALPIK
jgi:mono/diheme cytochrome c family protein